MRYGKLIALAAILLPFSLFSAEPSAFGAGDLNNPEPYGLTASEEALLENKKHIQEVVIKSKNQANEVDSLRERVDGIQSILEGISQSSRNNKMELKSVNEKHEEFLKNSAEFDKRITDSTKLNNELIVVNAEDIKKINLSLIEVSKLIDKINISYVSKDEFNVLVNDINKFKDLVSKELSGAAKTKSTKNVSNGDVATQAKKFFDSKKYDQALDKYKYLISKNYKPARSHYMVGEIYYIKKNYAEAIAYFKKSAKLYSKASYMHNLMLHTAISMDNTGDDKNAKVFYNAVISKYPNSSSAEIAKNKLSLIK